MFKFSMINLSDWVTLREGMPLLTTAQLTSEVQAHYISQGIKQAYVFILGLDVLGNPYGLYRDVKEGISDLFYEP